MILVPLLLVLSSLVQANDQAISSEDYLNKYGKQALYAVALGSLSATLEGACLKEVDGRGITNISNKSECLKEIDSQIEMIRDVPEMSEHLDYLNSIQKAYSLR